MLIKNSVLLVGFMLLINCGGGATTDTRTMPTLDLSSGNYHCAAIITNLGTLQIALDKINAPITVKNFLKYSTKSFYDGTVFHRVIPGFMIQAGGYDAAFNKRKTDPAITNEADNGLFNIRGAIAMARTTDPHSATSQFFINTVNNSRLNFSSKTSRGWGYAVFAWVVNGMDVVDAISRERTGSGGPFPKDVPQATVIIQSIDLIPCSSVNQQV